MSELPESKGRLALDPAPVNPPTTRSVPAPPAGPRPGYGAGYGAGYGVGAGYGAGYGVAAGESMHLSHYLRILHKRRWVMVTAFLLVFGTVTLFTFTATPIYEARAQVLIENENPNVVKIEEVYEQNKNTNDYYQTQYRILQSRLLARRTLDKEKLWENPNLVSSSSSSPGFSVNPLNWATSLYAFGKRLLVTAPAQTPEAPDAAETKAQSQIIDRFLRGLVVSPIRNSRLVDVRYRSSDPKFSMVAANAIAKQYIEQNLEFRYLATQEANQFLNSKMQEQRQALEQSEQALQKYREQTGAVSLEDRQNIVVQRLTDLNAAVTKARTERIEKEALYNQIRNVQNDRAALDTIPAILGNAFIQQLKAQISELQRQQAQLSEKLGQRHPEIVKVRSAIESTEARITAEVAKVVQSMRNDYLAAVANEESLQKSLDQQRAEAQELNRTAIRYGVLQRDNASNRIMFEVLLQRSKETGVSGELKSSNIRIVDVAELPRSVASPNKRNNMMLGFFGGLFFAVGLAFFFEYLDSRFKTPDELRTRLGLPSLGFVPAIDPPANGAPPIAIGNMPSHFTEAFRTVRTNVLFASAETGSKTVVVTSTSPGEGKTVVSANLALSLAQAGQRVLLVDGDMRRPKLHEFFRINQEPGLSNVLVSDTKASDAVKKTIVPNLWVLAAGKHPPNPAELLGSKRFADFLSSLGTHFDWIILDTPPVMAVADASVVAHGATGVVFVVGAEMTTYGSAKAALDQLDSARAKYIGAILNRVDLKRNAYYFSNYYRPSYSNYYEVKDTASART